MRSWGWVLSDPAATAHEVSAGESMNNTNALDRIRGEKKEEKVFFFGKGIVDRGQEKITQHEGCNIPF